MQTELAGKTVLIVDDDDLFCDAVKDYLGDRGLRVLAAHTGAAAVELASRERLNVILLDQRLPDVEGQELCQSLRKVNERVKIIFVTAHASFDAAVKAIREGAHDYLTKPVELEELLLAVRQAVRVAELEQVDEVERYRRSKESQTVRLVGTNGTLAEVARMIAVAAASDAPVLITGETGTGKNVVAKIIHFQGSRRSGPFIPLNCAALPENLIESELFGYEKGAFTGAERAHRGVFEMAEGGTLFLDEIGEMPIHLQTKLLTALEDHQIRRLGSERHRPVNVRLLSATAASLDSALGTTFREDMYYRLSVVRIHMPPLRERIADLPALCEHLLAPTSLGKRARVRPDEIARLAAYAWPGNVRELKNVLERAVLLQAGPDIEPSKLLAYRGGSPRPGEATRPPASAEPPQHRDGVRRLQEVEREYLLWALEQYGDNYTRTAKALDIALSTLKRKLRSYGRR